MPSRLYDIPGPGSRDRQPRVDIATTDAHDQYRSRSVRVARFGYPNGTPVVDVDTIARWGYPDGTPVVVIAITDAHNQYHQRSEGDAQWVYPKGTRLGIDVTASTDVQL